MAISLRKTIPTTSSYYTATTSDVTITMYGVEEITINSKKDVIAIQTPKTKARQIIENTDKFDVKVVDLKQGQDQINIKGYIEDDGSETAWNKYWKLRAMSSRGGPLNTLIIDNITFSSATQQAFLTDVQVTRKADDTSALNALSNDGTARLQVSLTLVIGTER